MTTNIHSQNAGRFHWKKAGTRPTRKLILAAFDFEHGTLMLTESGTKKRAALYRAALYMVADENGLAEHDRDGLDVLNCSFGIVARPGVAVTVIVPPCPAAASNRLTAAASGNPSQ